MRKPPNEPNSAWRKHKRCLEMQKSNAKMLFAKPKLIAGPRKTLSELQKLPMLSVWPQRLSNDKPLLRQRYKRLKLNDSQLRTSDARQRRSHRISIHHRQRTPQQLPEVLRQVLNTQNVNSTGMLQALTGLTQAIANIGANNNNNNPVAPAVPPQPVLDVFASVHSAQDLLKHLHNPIQSLSASLSLSPTDASQWNLMMTKALTLSPSDRTD